MSTKLTRPWNLCYTVAFKLEPIKLVLNFKTRNYQTIIPRKDGFIKIFSPRKSADKRKRKLQLRIQTFTKKYQTSPKDQIKDEGKFA